MYEDEGTSCIDLHLPPDRHQPKIHQEPLPQPTVQLQYPKQEGPCSNAPPCFDEEFFQTIRKFKKSGQNMEEISIKQVYDFLMSSVLNSEIEPPVGDVNLIAQTQTGNGHGD